MRRLFTLLLFCLLASCGRREVVDKAVADFKAKYPQWPVVKAYLAEDDAEHASVYIDFLSTPDTASSSKSSVREMKVAYRKTGNKWILFHESKSRYVGPATASPS